MIYDPNCRCTHQRRIITHKHTHMRLRLRACALVFVSALGARKSMLHFLFYELIRRRGRHHNCYTFAH